jgi:negative regulator of genetic competence, sporulation and motility
MTHFDGPPKHKIIFSKTDMTILIKFLQFMEVIALHKTAQVTNIFSQLTVSR